MLEVLVNENNFGDEVLESKEIVFVDFYSKSHVLCNKIEPFLSQIADKYEGVIKVCKVDIEQSPELVTSCGVTGLPTLLVFRDGSVIEGKAGNINMAQLEDLVSKYA